MRYTHTDAPDSTPDARNAGPEPSFPELRGETATPVAVPVIQSGPVTTHELPARVATMFEQVLTPELAHVLGADSGRKVATLVCTGAWRISTHPGRPGVRWPADVPLVLTHADAVYASAGDDDDVLTVIVENWAD